MKKILVLLSIVSLVSLVLLSGCVDQGTGSNETTSLPSQEKEPATTKSPVINSNVEPGDDAGNNKVDEVIPLGDETTDDNLTGQPPKRADSEPVHPQPDFSKSNSTEKNGWCDPGSKVKFNGRELTVRSMDTFNNKEVCVADIITGDQQIIHVFSEDGSIDKEDVYSVGKNANSVSNSNAYGNGNVHSGVSSGTTGSMPNSNK